MATPVLATAAAEEVVLLDKSGVPEGTALKSAVHHADTPLHLAFSLFLFDRRGNFLAQRRSRAKKTWPGVWSNSCCGHPRPGEPMDHAVRRRTRFELRIELGAIEPVLPDFRYRVSYNGVWENELCPVWVGLCQHDGFVPNPEEVAAWAWVPWSRFLAASRCGGTHVFAHFSPWSLLEANRLGASPRFTELMQNWSSAPPRSPAAAKPLGVRPNTNPPFAACPSKT